MNYFKARKGNPSISTCGPHAFQNRNFNFQIIHEYKLLSDKEYIL